MSKAPSSNVPQPDPRPASLGASRRYVAAWGLLAAGTLATAVTLFRFSEQRASQRTVKTASAERSSVAANVAANAMTTTDRETAENPFALEIRYENGRITLAALDVPRTSLLKRLAARVGFDLVMQAPLGGTITLQCSNVPVEEVLQRVLENVIYGVEYGFKAGASAHHMVLVRVGAPQLAPSPAAQEGATDPSTTSSRRPSWLPQPSADSSTAHERRLAHLQSSDPAERLGVVRQLPPVGTAVEQLRALATQDPDPAVRAAAVQQLGGGDDYAATRTLIDALNDSEPNVVLQALSSLADVGDVSVIPDLRRMLGGSQDVAIRAALEATAASLIETARVDPERPEIVIGRDRQERRSAKQSPSSEGTSTGDSASTSSGESH